MLINQRQDFTHTCMCTDFSIINSSFYYMCVCVWGGLHIGSPADGILFPGDQVLQINDSVLEDMSKEQVENVLR